LTSYKKNNINEAVSKLWFYVDKRVFPAAAENKNFGGLKFIRLWSAVLEEYRKPGNRRAGQNRQGFETKSNT
jgi:hypothetical protein